MLTGVILAGGRNNRIRDTAKSILPFGSEPVVKRQLPVMSQLCNETILVTDDPGSLLPTVGRSSRIITEFFSNLVRLEGCIPRSPWQEIRTYGLYPVTCRSSGISFA